MVADNKKTRWHIVFVATLAGIVAATQIGMVPPAIPEIRADLGVGLVTIGWIVSVFNLMAAILAIAIGMMADRMDIRKVISAGIVMLILGAVAGGFSHSAFSLIGARVIAGLGLVSIAVAAPRLIVGASHTRDYGLTLGIWSTYMPSGIALGMLITPYLLASLDWRQTWFVNAGMLGVILILFLWASRFDQHQPSPRGSKGTRWSDVRKVTHVPGPWLLGGIFVCYSISFFAMMSWFPFFLIETQGKDAVTAGALGALVVAANVIGNISAAVMLRRGFPRWAMQLTAFVVMACCAVGVFSSLVGSEWKVVLAFLFSGVGGFIPSTILSASALHAPTPGQVGTVNGFIVQGSNMGSLSGPPLMAVVVGISGGWLGSWWLSLIVTALGIVLVLKLRAIEAHLKH